ERSQESPSGWISSSPDQRRRSPQPACRAAPGHVLQNTQGVAGPCHTAPRGPCPRRAPGLSKGSQPPSGPESTPAASQSPAPPAHPPPPPYRAEQTESAHSEIESSATGDPGGPTTRCSRRAAAAPQGPSTTHSNRLRGAGAHPSRSTPGSALQRAETTENGSTRREHSRQGRSEER